MHPIKKRRPDSWNTVWTAQVFQNRAMFVKYTQVSEGGVTEVTPPPFFQFSLTDAAK